MGYRRLGSDITPQQVLRVGCFWTKTENEPITVQVERMFDWLAEETSIIKSPGFNFVIECASPRTEWKVFARKNGNVFLNDMFEEISVRLIIKYRVKLEVCVICGSLREREEDKEMFSYP